MEFTPEFWDRLQIVGLAVTAVAATWTFGFRLCRGVKKGALKIMSYIARKMLALSDHDKHEAIAHNKIFEALEHVAGRVELLLDEWRPNGGTSQADKLDRIELAVAYQGAFQLSALHTWTKAVFITNEEGKCTYVNNAHSRLTGFRPDECMGNDWINVITPEERADVLSAWNLSIEQGTVFDMIITYVKPGNEDPYKVHVHAIKIQSHGIGAQSHGYLGEVRLS